MKKIKPVIQKDLKDCGVCCMQWVFMYYDGYLNLEKLRMDTYTSKDGTSAYHICEAFKKWDFDAIGVLEHDLQKKEVKFPLIAHLVLENGLEHFVIVKSIIKNTIYLMDPSVGDKKMSITEFNKLFTGHIILMHPRNKLIKMDKKTSINNLFLKILSKEKFLFIKIIVSSFLLTFLSIVSSYYLKIGSTYLDNDSNILKYIIIVFLIITLLKVFMLYIREYYKNHLNNLVDVYIYPSFINHLFSIPLKNIHTRTPGEIMTRIDELSSVKILFSDVFVQCFLDSFMMMFSVIILFMINKDLTFVLLFFSLIYILIGIIINKVIYKKILETINYQTNFNIVALESVEMLDSIKHLNVINSFLKKIEYVLSKYLFVNFKFNNFFNITSLTKDFILELLFFIINSYGFYKVINLEISIVDLFTYNLLLSYCIDPIRNLIALLPKYNYVKATFIKLLEFIEIDEEKNNQKKEILKGDIKLHNISYSYNNYDYILKDCNLLSKEDKHVFLKGHSGCGKSTICKLIYQDYSLNKGDIYIGNKNLKDIDLNIIRENILYVSQSEKLFFGTIKENILCGRKINDDFFLKICQICQVDKIVAKKEMRYNALIEPTISNISGGEMQRIILARGLLKNANILILDEALSEVDSKCEKEIIKDIRDFYKDKTIIYISHNNQNSSFEKIINIGDSYGIL